MEIQTIHEPLMRMLNPTIALSTWNNNTLELIEDATHWGFIYQGNPQLHRSSEAQTFSLYPRMYFCLPDRGSIGGENSCGIVVTCRNTDGMFSMGGPVESKGRFAYIDGGANSVLIPPIDLGAPCLNALYFPPGCDQTMHTHPSYRIAVVLDGSGEGETLDRTLPLQAGNIVLIPPDSPHKFRTRDSSLSFVVFHPDSDIGFTHRNNPMLNRTFVAGISAVDIPEIQTSLSCVMNSKVGPF